MALSMLGLPTIAFIASKSVQRYLHTERSMGEWRFRFYGAKISPTLNFRADSVGIQSSHERIFASSLQANLLNWTQLWSRRAVLRVAFDSMNIRLSKRQDSTAMAPEFPPVRFILPVLLEWKTLEIRPEGRTILTAEKGRWKSDGPWGMKGRFKGRWKLGPDKMGLDSVQGQADFKAEARWRGKNVRYRLEILERGDTVRVMGTRMKKSLLQGEDSLHIRIQNPSVWIPASWLEPIPEASRFLLRGKIDWSNRKLWLKGQLTTGEFHVLKPFSWNWAFRADSIQGALELEGQGREQQSIHLQGEWKHPPEWLVKPDWNNYSGRFSARVKGVQWQIGTRNLPLQFTIPALILEPGLAASAQVVTSDSSLVDLRWSGENPRKLEFSGPISPRETWATIWTDTNLSYRSARVQGTWEDNRVFASAWFKEVRAYRAEADSVEALSEVLSTGYYLREAVLYSKGQAFKGSGQVIWDTPPGSRGTSLTFELSHPQYGHLRFAMPFPDSLVASAEKAQAALFPYVPLHRYARFHPLVSGNFFWNHVTGDGHSNASIDFSYQNLAPKTFITTTWNKDSLTLKDFQLQSGTSRLTGGGTLGLGGGSLAGLADFQPNAVGALNLTAEKVRIGEVLALAQEARKENAAAAADGLLDGDLRYAAGYGWQGTLRVADLRVPGLGDLMEVKNLSLTGKGDSLHLSAFTTSSHHALLKDTVDAHLSGLKSGSPDLEINLRSGPLAARFMGEISDWKVYRGNAEIKGGIPLGGKAGSLDELFLQGPFSIPIVPNPAEIPRFESRRFHLRYTAFVDTQWLDGQVKYSGNRLSGSDLKFRHSQGGELNGTLEARLGPPMTAQFDFSGPKLWLNLPEGLQFKAQEVAGSIFWKKDAGLRLTSQAQSGSFSSSKSPLRIQGGIEKLRLDVSIPPQDVTALPKVSMRGRVRDFFFQRRMGMKDVQAFFRSLAPGKNRSSGTSGRRSKSWETDLEIEAVGTNNRIDTDILRLSFLGDLKVKGVYPYTLFNGKLTGLQGEIGQTGQAYSLRDFEVKWENSTLDEGSIYSEGTKKLRADCAPTTARLCAIFINVNGRLNEMNFSYDSDCGEGGGEPIPPSVLINSARQDCYSAGVGGGGGTYSETALNMLEPSLNQNLTKGIKWASGGIIQSTQVSGLGSMMSNDTAGTLAPVALEVQTREKYRIRLKGKAGYHPESKVADPWEYRLAAEYRPPLENWVRDSVWKARLKDRFTVETSAETRPPEVRDEEARQVREQVGLRYKYRFWDLW